MEQPVLHSTFVIERSYPASAARIFEAFSREDQKRRWYADRDGQELTEFSSDFRVGGDSVLRFAMGPDTPFEGVEIANIEQYHDIVPDRRIVSAATMSLGGKPISVSLVTIELVPTESGTDLVCTHQGVFFEGSGGPEMREHGWRVLFDRLAAILPDA
jgi:uncharacterized protein YndB with AHSA1/START domain